MTDPVTAGAAGSTAIIKVFGLPLIASAAASALGFMFLWPKSGREALIRIICTVIFSTMLGPILTFMLHAWMPSLFESAKAVAMSAGMPAEFGLLGIAGPIMTLAGLPAWWLVGGIVLWLEKRKGEDIGQIIDDAYKAAHPGQDK